MTPIQYESTPQELQVHEVQVGGRILVTTLLNPRRVSKHELDKLYARRWSVELDLRNIKITLGMQALNCRTPQMSEKQMWVYLLAHNLIRLLMAQAAHGAGVDPRQLSFKHTVQLWTAAAPPSVAAAALSPSSPARNRAEYWLAACRSKPVGGHYEERQTWVVGYIDRFEPHGPSPLLDSRGVSRALLRALAVAMVDPK
jgi:hypothetical protein